MMDAATIEVRANGEKLSMEEIERRYPNEWVALADVDDVDMHISAGVVYAHHPDRDTLHAMAFPLRGGAIFWTGKIRSPRWSWPGVDGPV